MTQTIFTSGHALLVGVGADLPNTITDAQGLADVLRDSNRCAYPPEQVHLLTGAQAARVDILTALKQLAETTSPDSAVLIYFSGHGYRVKAAGNEKYYLLPHGYDITRLEDTCISGETFAACLRAFPARRLLLLLDCCHAGGVGVIKTPDLTLTKAPLPPEAVALFQEGSGRVLVASSREDEVSYAGKPYSAFTRALLEAFCGMGVSKPDGYVRAVDLALHAREIVPQRTGGKQHPILDFEKADNFVLAYYAGGDTKPKGLPFAMPPEEVASSGFDAGQEAQCRDLKESINETLALLREYEEQRRLTHDPITRRSAEKEIQRFKADLVRYRAEYQEAGCTAVQPAADIPPAAAPVMPAITIIGNGNVIGDDNIVTMTKAGDAEGRARVAPDSASLRRQLQKLDDVALDTLCMDHFPTVYDAFSRGTRRDEKINLLLDHVRRNPEAVSRLAALLSE